MHQDDEQKISYLSDINTKARTKHEIDVEISSLCKMRQTN